MRLLPALATALTPVAGLVLFVPQMYIAQHCFQRGTLSGCSYTRESFFSLLGAAPHQVGFIAVLVLVLTGLAYVATASLVVGREEPGRAALAIGGYALLAAGISVVNGPHFIGPLLMLVAAHAQALGASPTHTSRILVVLAVLVLGAFAGAYAFLLLWGVRLGALPIGGSGAWLYVSLASAAGLASGVLLAALRRDAKQIARGLILGYASFGGAGLAVGLASLAVLYPHGTYVSLGITVLWLSVRWLIIANLVTGVIAWLAIGRVGWPTALLAGPGFALIVAATALLSVMTLTGIAVAGASADPPLLMLPSTATSE